MIIVSKYCVPKGFMAMALFPFIFLRHKKQKNNKELINHERIHLRQQLELFVLPFYVFYTIEFVIRLLITQSRKDAYLSISFEKEAHTHEKDSTYLKARKFWNFMYYF